MFLMDLAVLILLTAGGVFLAVSIDGEVGKLEALGLGFPIGAGAFTWLQFVASALQLPLGPVVVLGTAGLVALLPLAIHGYRALSARAVDNHKREDAQARRSNRLLMGVFGVAVLLLAGAAALVSVVTSYSSWDAVAIWAAKGYGISAERTIFAAEFWGAHRLANPLNLPILISTFQTLTGDVLPGSKLIFPMFFASLLLALGAHSVRRGSRPYIAVSLVALLGTTPLLFLHATIGYANLAYSTYLIMGLLMGVEAIQTERRGAYLLSGMLLALAAWTREEGLWFAALSVVVISGVGYLLVRKRPRVAWWLLPMVVVMAPWLYLTSDTVSSGQIAHALRGFWPRFTAGQFNTFELYLIPRLFLDRALDPSQWGVLWPVLIVLFLMAVPRLDPRKNVEFSLLACLSLIAALLPVGYFYVESFTRSDFYVLLNRSFDRAFIPATLLIGSLVISMFRAPAPEGGPFPGESGG